MKIAKVNRFFFSKLNFFLKKSFQLEHVTFSIPFENQKYFRKPRMNRCWPVNANSFWITRFKILIRANFLQNINEIRGMLNRNVMVSLSTPKHFLTAWNFIQFQYEKMFFSVNMQKIHYLAVSSTLVLKLSNGLDDSGVFSVN